MSPLAGKKNSPSVLSDEATGAGVQRNVNTYFDATVAYWDEIYRGDELQGLIYQQRQEAVLRCVDAAAPKPQAKVLEIGCGAGHLTAELAQRDLQVEALDSSPGMVDLASRQLRERGLEQVRVSLADVHNLPFDSASFDLVIAVGVIPWLHTPREAVVEMARVLTPAGQLIVTADNAARLSSFTDPRGMLALTPLRRVYHSLLRRDEAVSQLHFPWRVDRLLASAQLRPLGRATTGFGPFSFLGRPILGPERAVRVNHRLQALADRGVPGIRWTGWHYVVRAGRA
jgi:ubiquinone/menaquinone biosynthesis C-methylase UbiE